MNELFKQVTLLYVEDDDTIRPILERTLKRKMKDIFVACDGAQGYDMFKEHSPDIILTDIKMPKMDGLEMSEKIREIDSKVPIIVLSAHSEKDFFIEAIEIGISGYLVKPIDKEKLFSELERNTKVVLFEKNKKAQEELLQNLIDMQPSIVFLENKDKNMLFANKLFLDSFNLKTQLNETNYSRIYNELKEKNNVKLKNTNDDNFWLDYIFESKNESFEIEVLNEFDCKTFLVKTKHIEKNNDDFSIITLVELT